MTSMQRWQTDLYWLLGARIFSYYTTAKSSDICYRNIEGKKQFSTWNMGEVFEIKEPYYNLRSEASNFQRENFKNVLIMVFNLCDI